MEKSNKALINSPFTLHTHIYMHRRIYMHNTAHPRGLKFYVIPALPFPITTHDKFRFILRTYYPSLRDNG